MNSILNPEFKTVLDYLHWAIRGRVTRSDQRFRLLIWRSRVLVSIWRLQHQWCSQKLQEELPSVTGLNLGEVRTNVQRTSFITESEFQCIYLSVSLLFPDLCNSKLLNETESDMKNHADRGRCYSLWLTYSSVQNTFRDLGNSFITHYELKHSVPSY